MRYEFKIEGVSPLLMHSNNIEARDQMEEARRKMKGGKPGDDRSPADTWKTYLYVSETTENVCVPHENLLSCLLQGGMKVALKGKETLKTHSQFIMFDALEYDVFVGGKTIARAAIDKINGEFGEHSNAARDLGFRLLVKPCTVGTKSHVRVRPIFHKWALQGSFEIAADDAEVLTMSRLKDLWDVCGYRIGVGDWRPGPGPGKRPGQYGRFRTTIERAG
jgi:hypothetical protein